mmetsp:Transcript_40188/g.87817  ORF Transcript_40188/g.87817 Transcript_40188/m.87817 type:complete len:945 (-) Transcript_40188:111-2945(-)
MANLSTIADPSEPGTPDGSPKRMAWEGDEAETDDLEGSQRTSRRSTRGALYLTEKYNKAKADATGWVDRRLQIPARMALMLPSVEVDKLIAEGREVLPQGVRVVTSAETSFGSKLRHLWVLELENPLEWEHGARTHTHTQLNELCTLIENATNHVRPTAGPWCWPLHNKEVSTAIFASHLESGCRKAPMWRQVLWWLRVHPPPGGPALEAQLTRQYGSAVGYVFSWTNLFIQGLWALAVPLAFAGILGVRPQQLGVSSISWNALQIWVLIWAQALAHGGRLRHRVLRAGGGASKVQLRAARAEACRRERLRAASRGSLKQEPLTSGELEASPGTSSSLGGSISQVPCSREPEASLRTPSPLDSILDAIPQVPRALSSEVNKNPPPPDPMMTFDKASAGTDSMVTLTLSQIAIARRAAVKIQAIARGRVARKLLKSRLQKVLVLSRYAGAEIHARVRRRNPDFRPPPPGFPPWWQSMRRMAAAVVVSAVSLLFVSVALLVLLSFVTLNAWLTYGWGECASSDLNCRDPQHRHGFNGWLAEVASDISLAIVFDVLLGEACKGLAAWAVGLWNYEWLYTKQYRTVMQGLYIEVLSKVGVFVILAFAFLPRWREPDEAASTRAACSGYLDYDVCVNMEVCEANTEHQCCSNALFCLAATLPFEKKRLLFEKSVKGPFMVAPFVRIIPTVLVPWLMKQMNLCMKRVSMMLGSKALAQVRPVGNATLRCHWRFLQRILCAPCRVLPVPVVRLLALIFALDCDHVGGLYYVVQGWPFRRPVLVNAEEAESEKAALLVKGALEQVVLKEFEPLDELLELKMSFLFIIFFSPVMPLGVVPTLVARLLEIRTKLTKLFLIRRRSMPEDARLVHDTQGTFTMMVAKLAVVWHSGLYFVSYNPSLAAWRPALVVSCWLGFSLAFITLLHLVEKQYVRWTPCKGTCWERLLRQAFPT